MPRVSLTINEIRERRSGNACMIHPAGKIYFLQPITSSDRLQISVTKYNAVMTTDDIPERYQLAATYYVLSRYYSDIDADRANYYHRMYQQQWARVKHNHLASGRFDWGDDL